jgi:hypothetical protein
MATVNLGSIKFKWKGTYNGATAYTVDDVVEYNGSSYICILASTGNLPTNATYFEQMSSAGTNGTDGTDLGTTLTTQGDIVYRNASGLARLGAGTSGQLLQTNGTGANPSWITPASGGAKSFHEIDRTTHLASSTVDTWVQILNPITMTPADTSSTMHLHFKSILGVNTNSPAVHIKFTRAIGGGSETDLVGTMSKRNSANTQCVWSSGEETFASSNSFVGMPINAHYVDQPNTTSQVVYKVYFWQGSGSNSITMGSVYSSGSNDEYPAVDTRMMLTEL